VLKWRPFSFIFNRRNKKVGGWGKTVISFLVKKKSLVKKEVWNSALSWCNSQFFCRQSLGRNLRTFSHSHRKTSQQHAEITVWPVRTNYLWTIALMSKKRDEHSLDIALHMFRLFFFGLGEFSFPCTAHDFFYERFSNDCQGLRHTLSETCTKFDAVPLSDP
jgi:hypothetical protein